MILVFRFLIILLKCLESFPVAFPGKGMASGGGGRGRAPGSLSLLSPCPLCLVGTISEATLSCLSTSGFLCSVRTLCSAAQVRGQVWHFKQCGRRSWDGAMSGADRLVWVTAAQPQRGLGVDALGFFIQPQLHSRVLLCPLFFLPQIGGA